MLESGIHAVDSGFQVLEWIPDSSSVELEFFIPMVSGILDFTGKKFPDFGIRITFDWAKYYETNDKQILSNRKQRKPLIMKVFHDL